MIVHKYEYQAVVYSIFESYRLRTEIDTASSQQWHKDFAAERL